MELPSWLTGTNALDIPSTGITLAMLTADSAVVADAHTHMHTEVQVETGFEADGIMEDSSFGQHKGLLYNGRYAAVFYGSLL